MKTIIISSIILLSFCFVHSVSSQLAIRGGVNLSNISFDDGISLETDSKAGIQAGLMYSIGIADRIAIRPGAIFSVKGYKNVLEESVDFKYLEMPLSFLFYISGGKNGLYLELGPYAGAVIDNNFEDLDEDLKTLDVGFNLGAGFEIGNLGVGLTYGYGLGSILDGEYVGSEKITNTNIGLFGYIQF